MDEDKFTVVSSDQVDLAVGHKVSRDDGSRPLVWSEFLRVANPRSGVASEIWMASVKSVYLTLLKDTEE
jgi:hypothetical protein